MANRVFYFFYAPTWDYPPNGPIKLGNVLLSVKKPERALYTAPLPTDAEVVSSEKRQVEFSKEKLRAGEFSILTRFLSFLGLGFDVGVNWDKANEESFTFERLETTQFIPTAAWLEKCLASPSVQRYLEKSRYHKPIYVITGLKTVTGAAVKTNKCRAFGGKVGVEVDGTVWSGGVVPVAGGPEVGGKRETKDGMSWEDHGDFIFAYRVSKVWVKRGAVMEEDYVKGAMLGKELEKAGDIVLEVAKVEEADPEVEGFLKEEVMNGDEKVIIAVPQREEDDAD